MGAGNKEFVPGPNCSSADMCTVLGQCQEATIIEQEMTYDSDIQRVEHQESISKCKNPQARSTRKKAREYLDK